MIDETKEVVILVPAKLADEIVKYLVLRPWGEVHPMIMAISRCEKSNTENGKPTE